MAKKKSTKKSTQPKFPKKNYLDKCGSQATWKQISSEWKTNPNSSQLRQVIGKEVFQDPRSMIGLDGYVVDAYVTGGKVQSSTELYDITKANLDRLTGDIVGSFSKPEDSVQLLINLPVYEGGRYKPATLAAKTVALTRQNIETKNMNAVSHDMIGRYGSGYSNAIAIHAQAHADSLLRIYGNVVLGARVGDLVGKFTAKDGSLNGTQLEGYSKYVFNGADDPAQGRFEATEAIANAAYPIYKQKL